MYMKSVVLNQVNPNPTNIEFADHPEFVPNLTPAQIFAFGVFGGTYWRTRDSPVTGKRHENEWDEIPSLKALANSYSTAIYMLAAKEFDVTRNKYGVPAGSSLEEWEAAGWVDKQDPYGWLQWYCRFYEGRRSPDDERQIKRWLGFAGPKGRFRNQLINQIREALTVYTDLSISKTIRQSLLQWGYELTEEDFKAYGGRVKPSVSQIKNKKYV